MTALWMVYGSLLAALTGAAAWAAERGLRAAGRPVRGVWVVALLGALALSAAAGPGGRGAGRGPLGSSLQHLLVDVPAAAMTVSGPGGDAVVVEGVESVPSRPGLALAWGLGSGALLLLLAGSWAYTARGRARWPRVSVDGVSVLVSPATGPAAIGLARGAIVLPRWALGLDSVERRLLLLHEQEHLRGGDLRVLAFSMALLCAFPWCLPLWWIHRRLHLAVEMDCDHRVLRRFPRPGTYGRLLLRVGTRRARPVLLTAFGRPRSFLRRRIEGLATDGSERKMKMRNACVGIAVAAVLVGLACDLPGPSDITGPEDSVSGVASASGARIANKAEVSKAVLRLAEKFAGGATGVVNLEMAVGPEGGVRGLLVLNSDVPEDQKDAAVELARGVRFDSPEVDGEPVMFRQPLWVRYEGDVVKVQLLRYTADNTWQKAAFARQEERAVIDRLSRAAGWVIATGSVPMTQSLEGDAKRNATRATSWSADGEPQTAAALSEYAAVLRTYRAQLEARRPRR